MNYSNAESEITTAFLLGDFAAGTQVKTVSESNLASSTSGQANSNVDSNTALQIEFFVQGAGIVAIDFLADLTAEALVNGGDTGIAQANTSASLTLRKDDDTVLVRWAMEGNSIVQECTGAACLITADDFSLNLALTSSGSPDTGGGVMATLVLRSLA